jgi:CMP/dCMP kinase
VPLIAIDGPAGSGKSTLARALAARLGVGYLDSGAMYRAVAFATLRDGIDPADGAAVAALAGRVAIDVNEHVLVDGVDATTAIRQPDVNRAVSIVSAHPAVREHLVRQQRNWIETRGGDGVVEGRDIGTVVFPDADLKVFLTADETVRASRRKEERDIAARDHLDSTRAASPLARAADAVPIDTSDASVDETVERVLALLK